MCARVRGWLRAYGNEWDNVHDGLIMSWLLALGLGTAGLIWGSLLARKVVKERAKQNA